MKLKKVDIQYVLLIAFCFCLNSKSIAQGQWIPTIGLHTPGAAPTMFDVQVDSKSGLAVGATYRMGNKKIFFNPTLLYVHNSADLLRVDTLNGGSGSAPQFIDNTTLGALRLSMGGGAILSQFSESSNMHLRAAFITSFNMGSPDWTSVGLREDAQRQMNWEFLFGLGFDISKITIAIDANLSLLREFRDADIVRNSFTISLGYQL